MDNNERECPYCGQVIKVVAKKCRHCGQWLDASAGQVQVSTNVSAVNSPNSSLDHPMNENQIIESCLADIKELEDTMLPQLEYIGDKIDETYKQVANVVVNLADTYVKNSKLSSRSANKLMLGAVLVGGIIESVGEYNKAKKHNEMLDKMLQMKIQVANAKYDVIKRILPKADATLLKTQKIFFKYIENNNINYSDVIKDRNTYVSLAERDLTAIELYRRSRYCMLVAHHLYEEYNAWRNGMQTSGSILPGYDTVNFEIEERYFSGDVKKSFNDIMNKQIGQLTTRDFFLLIDEQLTSVAIDYKPIIVNENNSLVGTLTTYVPSPQSDDIRNILKDNDILSDYIESRKKVGPLYEKCDQGCLSFIVSSLLVVGWIYLVYLWLWNGNHGFIAFLAWVFGSIMIGSWCGNIFKEEKEKAVQAFRDVEENMNSRIKATYGFTYRPDVDYNKKSFMGLLP